MTRTSNRITSGRISMTRALSDASTVVRIAIVGVIYPAMLVLSAQHSDLPQLLHMHSEAGFTVVDDILLFIATAIGVAWQITRPSDLRWLRPRLRLRALETMASVVIAGTTTIGMMFAAALVAVYAPALAFAGWLCFTWVGAVLANYLDVRE